MSTPTEQLGRFAGELMLSEGVAPLDMCRALVLAAVAIYTRYHCNDQRTAAGYVRDLANDVEQAAIVRDPTLRTVN